jgi:hypothetical protein
MALHMRRILLITLTLVTVSTAAVADAAPRSGTTSEGVRITLDGRTVSLRVPATVPRGARFVVYCGIERPPLSRPLPAQRTVRAVPRRRLRVTLARRARGAEFCGYRTENLGTERTGAAVLGAPRPSPPPVVPGPGVREGRTTDDDTLPESGEIEGDEGDAVLLTVDTRLTIRLREPLPRSTVLRMACGRSDSRRGIAYRAVVVRGGQRVVTADIGAVRPDADLCLVEEIDGGDLAGALLGPPA